MNNNAPVSLNSLHEHQHLGAIKLPMLFKKT